MRLDCLVIVVIALSGCITATTTPRDMQMDVAAGPADATTTCSDGVKNGGETDVDCGGGSCASCNEGKACLLDSDCQSAVCTMGQCGSRSGGVATFSKALVTSLTPFEPTNLFVDDINTDGHADILAISSIGLPAYEVILGKGDGTFMSPGMVTSQTLPMGIVDLTGDGVPDLLSRRKNPGNPNQYYAYCDVGDGAGGFSHGTASPVCTDPTVPRFADLNRDQKLDLVVNGFSMLGNGDCTFQIARDLSLPEIRLGLDRQLGDLNGDGTPDMVTGDAVAAGQTAYVNVYLGNGDGTFATSARKTKATASVVNVRLADFNGDGNLDILAFELGATGQNSFDFFAGNGDGTVSAAVHTAVGASGVPQVADFDGDGLSDVVLNSPVLVLPLRKDGTFNATVVVDTETSYEVAAADFTGDGKPDIAAVDSMNRLRIYINTTH